MAQLEDRVEQRHLVHLIETFWNDTKGGRIFVGDTTRDSTFFRLGCARIGSNLAIACGNPAPNVSERFDNFQIVVDFRPRFTAEFFTKYVGTPPNQIRVYSVYALGRHEFGHTVGFSHASFDKTSVMYAADVNGDGGDRWPGEVDRRGVAMLYGPYTGFDFPTANGITYPNNEDGKYQPGRKDVANYYNQAGTVPELSPVSASSETPYNNVKPDRGSGMERFAGTSRSSYAYTYYPIFSQADDERSPGGYAKTTIVDGMRLRWMQYNYQQTTFSVDAEFADGTTLRDFVSGGKYIVDQNGVRIHPKYRRYATGTWHYFDVNLSLAAGKEVKRWLIAYDNQDTQWVGQFRAYFDTVRIVYPTPSDIPAKPLP